MKHSSTILLVEDDQSMLDGIQDLLLAKDLLQEFGIGYDIQVLTAGDGSEALQVMANHTPDLILSDIMMPKMDGFQLLQEVRKNPAWINIPYIFLTARGEEQEIQEGRLSGANLYITKPFDTRELLELLKSQLDRANQLEDIRRRNTKALQKGILQILNHEFNTPLTYVMAYSEMLAESVTEHSDSESFQNHLRGIQEGCIRLTRLIEDFIMVMELRMGEAQSRYRRRIRPLSNIDALLQKSIHNNQPQARQNGVQIHYTAAQNLPTIFGDWESLLQVFDRLLDNAVKFTHCHMRINDKVNGNVYVSASQKENEVHILIKDEGTGFPAQVKERIFELFFQYNRALTEQQGAGTGLTIAKRLVDLHNGRIEVVSEENVGSEFTVVLPINKGDFAQIAPADSNVPRKQATVLVVEDDAYLLTGMQELLEIFDGKYQLNVLTANNGKRGLKILDEIQPDLIISDIMMPKMGGYEFLQQVRQNPNWLQIPFIFLTAKGERSDIHRGRLSGAEEYITKPYDSDVLLGLIVKQLDKYFQLQDILAQSFDALKSNILNLITPDFRLPLSTVAKYSSRLEISLRDTQTDEELKESLRGIQAGSVRLTRLIEDFIALAEIRTSEAETVYQLRAQPIQEIGFLLVEAAQIHTPTAERKHVSIHCSPPNNLPLVFGNGDKLLDCVQRLIGTGIEREHTAGNNIYLSGMHSDDEVHLSVRFEAPLGEDETNEILTILYEDDPHSLESPDYARSLAIVRGYIELHGGRIQFNNNESKGYTFTIILPVYHKPPLP